MGEATEDREKLSNPPKATKDSKQSLDLSPCFELHPTREGRVTEDITGQLEIM